MKKILIIHHGIGVGGGLIALLGLIDELKTKNEVRVLSIFDSEAVEYIRKADVKVYLPKSKFYSKLYRLFVHSEASYFSLFEMLLNFKNLTTYLLSKYYFSGRELGNLDFEYELVYLNSTFISDWSLSAKKLDKKTIIHVREPLAKGIFGFRKCIIRNSIKKYCDKIVAISIDNANRVGLIDKTTIVYDPVVLMGRSTSNEIALNSNYKYFLYLGGMQRIKGFEQLVKSLRYLDDNIRIFFLGGDMAPPSNKIRRLFSYLDPYMWRIDKLVSIINKSDKIIKVGLIDNIFDYYQNSIALISPFSKPHASLPVLEAFSAGKPVVVSDIVGMDEIVNNDNGLFFKNNDSIALAKAINKMASLDMLHYYTISQNAQNTYDNLIRNNGSVQFVIDSF